MEALQAGHGCQQQGPLLCKKTEGAAANGPPRRAAASSATAKSGDIRPVERAARAEGGWRRTPNKIQSHSHEQTKNAHAKQEEAGDDTFCQFSQHWSPGTARRHVYEHGKSGIYRTVKGKSTQNLLQGSQMSY